MSLTRKAEDFIQSGRDDRGIIEILPPSITQPDEADRQHLIDVAKASGRPVFFLIFDAQSRTWVEAATQQGAQLTALLRAIPFNPRFTLKKTTRMTSDTDTRRVSSTSLTEARIIVTRSSVISRCIEGGIEARSSGIRASARFVTSMMFACG